MTGVCVGIGDPTSTFEQLTRSKAISKLRRCRMALLLSLLVKFSCMFDGNETLLIDSAPNGLRKPPRTNYFSPSTVAAVRGRLHAMLGGGYMSDA